MRGSVVPDMFELFLCVWGRILIWVVLRQRVNEVGGNELKGKDRLSWWPCGTPS